MEHEENFCQVNYVYKRGVGLLPSTVYAKDPVKLPDGLSLKMGMKNSEIECQIPQDDFEFIKGFYKDKKQEPVWKAIREKGFIRAEIGVKGNGYSPIRMSIDPTKMLARIVKRMIHVPGLRGNPERTYKIAESGDIYPGSFEKYVANIISSWARYRRHKVKFEELKQQLVELGLATNIKTNKINDTRVEIKVSRTKGAHKDDCVNIVDVGFGVSQTLPVLIALLTAKKGQYVYIEQPELHLHPKAQFKLAKIITKAVNSGVKVVIETHSSILLRGIQIEVVTKGLDNDKVSLNWFTQCLDSGETQVSKATMDELGAFGEWPEDFDDVSLKVEQMYLDAVESAIYAN